MPSTKPAEESSSVKKTNAADHAYPIANMTVNHAPLQRTEAAVRTALKPTEQNTRPNPAKKSKTWIGVLALLFTFAGGFPGLVFAIWGYICARKAGNDRYNPSALWRLCMVAFAFMPAALLAWLGIIVGLAEGTI